MIDNFMWKIKSLGLALIVFFGSVWSINGQTNIVYTDAKELTLIGQPFPVNPNYYHRVDTLKYNSMPKPVKNLFTNAAGLAVVFKTNSDVIHAKWTTSNSKPANNQTPIANKGLDLYIKKDGKWQFAGVGRPTHNQNTHHYKIVENMEEGEKECLLYLPIYDEIFELSIGVNQTSYLKTAPNPFQKRIVIYGSSILQGASASRSGMTYPARMSRSNGLEFFNLGLSGNGKMEKEVADMLADIQCVDAFILDCIPNSVASVVHERMNYLVHTIRKAHPNTPIIVIQSVVREAGYFNQVIGERVKNQNIAAKEEFDRLIQEDVRDLYFIVEDNFLGDDHEGTTDGVHPNDLGFDRMLQKIQPQIEKILRDYQIL